MQDEKDDMQLPKRPKCKRDRKGRPQRILRTGRCICQNRFLYINLESSRQILTNDLFPLTRKSSVKRAPSAYFLFQLLYRDRQVDLSIATGSSSSHPAFHQNNNNYVSGSSSAEVLFAFSFVKCLQFWLLYLKV